MAQWPPPKYAPGRWREDLFLGDHLKIQAKTTTGGATPSKFYIDLVNFGPF